MGLKSHFIPLGNGVKIKMGHTVWSQRIASDIMLAELKSYGRALRKEDREIYERMLKLPLKRYGCISYASSIHVWAFLLLSIILEQEKKIKVLEHNAGGSDGGLADRRVQERK